MQSIVIDGQPKFYCNECANDLWIREVVFPGKRDGYFVEAGAADGVRGSSCYLLERFMGWRGLCIEPHETFFRALKSNRPRSATAMVCLANEAGWVDYAEAAEIPGTSPFLSGVRDVLVSSKWQGERVVAQAEITRKRAARLGDLLRDVGAPPVIEYAAFDIEGSEYEALRSFPFDQYRFLALSAELDGSIAGPFAELLAANGYRETANPFNQKFPWERYWLHESVATQRQ